MTQNEVLNESDAHVQQTTVVGIEAPELEQIDVASIAQFMRKRKRYEGQILEKNKDGLNINPVSWKMSVTETVMETMLEGKLIDADSIEKVTDEMIKNCLNERSKIAQSKIRIDHWDKIIKDVKMDMTIDDAQGRVYNFVVKYRNALRDHGYPEAISKNPELAIKHIRERVKPRRFQEHMEGILRIESHAELHKKDFGAYVRRLAEEADKFEYVQRSKNEGLNDSILPISVSSNKRKHDDEDDKRNIKPRRETPFCLNKEKCKGKRHFLKKCPNTTAEEARALLKVFRELQKKKNENGAIKKIGDQEQRSSTVFDAFFCDGKLETEVTADQGASANIIPKDIFDELVRLDGVKSTHKLARKATFDVFNKAAPPITCDMKVTADVILEIRHGKNLILRNVDWLVANEATSGIVIGRQLLNALGLNNRVLLMAAMTRVGDDIDIPVLYASTKLDLERTQDRSKVSLVSEHGITHGEPTDEMDDIEDEIYLDVGEDSESEIRSAMDKSLHDCMENGLSKTGQERLEDCFKKYKTIFD